jgi:hypothetical protein
MEPLSAIQKFLILAEKCDYIRKNIENEYLSYFDKEMVKSLLNI